MNRLTRVVLLGSVGYCVYFAGIYAATHVESSVAMSEANWTWGGVVAFAFASSEIFYTKAWRLDASLIRRLIVSCVITIVSLVAADPLCALTGIELRRDRSALVLPRVGIGLLVFVILAIVIYRWLNSFARTNISS